MSHAQNAKPGEIFIAPANGLMQKTLPFKVLKNTTHFFRKDDEFPANTAEFLNQLGYQPAPMVEDKGQYSIRGGIIDVFSSTEDYPIRIELFGDQIESLRSFSTSDQRSREEISQLTLGPAREYLFSDESHEKLLQRVRASLEGRTVDKNDAEEMLRSLVLKNSFPGIEFLLASFYDKLESPLDHFSSPVNLWILDPIEISRVTDEFQAELKQDEKLSTDQVIHPKLEALYENFEKLQYPPESREINLSTLEHQAHEDSPDAHIEYRTHSTLDFTNLAQTHPIGTDPWLNAAGNKIRKWREDGYRIFVGSKNQSHLERLSLIFEKWSSAPSESGRMNTIGTPGC